MDIFRPKPKLPKLHSTSVGDRSEAYVVARLIECGYVVLLPYGKNNAGYDLVIEDADGQFWRVQVKTGRYKDGCISWNAYTGAGSYSSKGVVREKKMYTEQEVDYFAVYCDATKTSYLVPHNLVVGYNGRIRVDPVQKRCAPHSRQEAPPAEDFIL